MIFIKKGGAVNVLSVFDAITDMKLPINLTCTLALAENFINSNNYRPSDILTSKKVRNKYINIYLKIFMKRD